jgi:pimeloyl-ACP methyl ester carboxylesterase
VADVYLYDLRGHGRSTVPEAGYAVADHVDDLDALLDAWGIDEPVHLVANSFGGVVALGLARRRPERVASMVLVEAHFATEGWGDRMRGDLSYVAFGFDDTRAREWVDENATRRQGRFYQRCEQLFRKTSLIDDLGAEAPLPNRALQAIEAPTLAIYGDGSDILDRAHDLEANLPRCELLVLDDCEHRVLVDRPADVRARTLDWIGRHAARRLATSSAGSSGTAPSASSVSASARR